MNDKGGKPLSNFFGNIGKFGVVGANLVTPYYNKEKSPYKESINKRDMKSFYRQ